MRNRKYTKEIGVATSEQTVSPAVAFVVLAVVAVLAIYFFRQVLTQPAHSESAAAPKTVKVSAR